MTHAPRNEHDERDRSPADDGTGKPERSWRRRRFGQAVAASAPVLMTLHSRPLRAGANCTVSGWVSGNTSLHHELEACGGRTPGYWQGPQSKRDFAGWRDSHDKPLNDPAFGFYFLDATVDGLPATLQQAVERQTPLDGLGNLGQQLVRFGTAALLNARYRRPPYPLNEQRVRDLLLLGLEGGGTTDRGDYLTADQVKAFLENTMDTPTWG